MIGTTVSHYRVIDTLGDGGMGVVYKAEDTRLHRFVALKFLPPVLAGDPQALVRFQREAQAASALNHPNICTIFDVGEQDGQAFIAMEFLDGLTLKDLIAGKPLEIGRILDLGTQIGDALDAAHATGIIQSSVLTPKSLHSPCQSVHAWLKGGFQPSTRVTADQSDRRAALVLPRRNDVWQHGSE